MNTNLDIQIKPWFSERTQEPKFISFAGQTAYERAAFKQYSLDYIMQEFGPLPDKTLLLGIADDGLPILLNLLDPTLGSLLIAGDTSTGKTKFLKALSGYIAAAHQPEEMQFAVITNKECEWASYIDSPCNIGVFSLQNIEAGSLISALSLWIEMNQSNGQILVLLIDGLEELVLSNNILQEELRKILLFGPQSRVWPIATVNLERSKEMSNWFDCFCTRIYSHTQNVETVQDVTKGETKFVSLLKGEEFATKENGQWLRFQIIKS